VVLNKAIKHVISEEEYLQGELLSEVKHELIDGEVYVMEGVSSNHVPIKGNVYRKLGNFSQNLPCEPFSSDVKVKVGKNFFYPDVMVVCDEQTEHEHPYYSEFSTILVEVLSGSTRRVYQTIKRNAYQSISYVQEYALIDQDFVDVEVCRKRHAWLSQHYFLCNEFYLESISIKFSIADIYQRVQNDGVINYLQQQADFDAIQ